MDCHIFDLPARVLYVLGGLDIVRGVMHTFLLHWSAVHVASFDPHTTPPDQFFLLGAFGISNFLTGLLYLLIAWRARQLAPYVLIAIPFAYVVGMVGISLSGTHMKAAFEGKYFMLVYLAVCVVTFLVFQVRTVLKRA